MDAKDLKLQKEKVEGFINSPDYRPMAFKDIVSFLNVPGSETGNLKRILDEMLAEGAVLLTKREKYQSAASMGLVSGVFSCTRKGYGFVHQEYTPDIFIPPDNVNTAMSGDLVLCRIVEEGEPSGVGEIVSVLSRHKKFFVGVFEGNDNGGFVTPDDKRLVGNVRIASEFLGGAKDGQKVKVQIDKFNPGSSHDGRIVQVLGNPMDLGMDVLSVVEEHDIPHVFPDAVLKQADSMPKMINESDVGTRKDFRALPTVTIDGEDTKDIDDAVSLERLEDGGFRLYVHIADVSHYVTPGSPLWKEAFERATSVYLADRVIPMLPPELSNGICSLNPKVDRLAMSCVMDIDKFGKVFNHEICKSVIHSNDAVTYTALADMLENENSVHWEKYPEFRDIFKGMETLAGILHNKRLAKGALEFDFPECKILVDAEAGILEIKRRERDAATNIIEEFMVCANEVVATEYYWMEIPFVYRVHEEPHKEKIEALMTSLRSLGFSLKKGGTSHAKNLQDLLKKVEGTLYDAVASKLILRSLKQARYYPQALGHFGLATEYYSHFTSPIRRFPDLMIHSIMSMNLEGKLDKDQLERLNEILPDICKHSSDNERRADDCAKEVERMKKVEYMQDKIGLVFDAMICHAAPSGFFVELENTVEGMVAISSIKDDFYEYQEDRYRFAGRRHGRSFSLGDKLRVKLIAAHMDLRRLDFELVDDEDDGDE